MNPDYPELLERLREIGWTLGGNLEAVLKIEKSVPDSRIRAQVVIQNLGEYGYFLLGRIYSPKNEIRYFSYNGSGNMGLINIFRIIVGEIETYFIGSTNDPLLSRIRHNYRIK